MRIGAISQALGVSVDTIRRLERRGVIVPSRDWAGHRRFTDEDLVRLRKILYPMGGNRVDVEERKRRV